MRKQMDGWRTKGCTFQVWMDNWQCNDWMDKWMDGGIDGGMDGEGQNRFMQNQKMDRWFSVKVDPMDEWNNRLE